MNERKQLEKHWRGIDRCLVERRLRRLVTQIENNLPIGHYLRQFHNVLGYQAWGGLADGGLCQGCFYRTAAFVAIPQCARNGATTAEAGAVHVEHTVPIASLITEIQSQKHQLLSGYCADNPLESPLYAFLLKYSITTAAARIEGNTERGGGMVVNGYARNTQALDCENALFNRPFSRYIQPTTIYDLVTNSSIDFNAFTFDDHLKNVNSLLDAVKREDLKPRHG